LNSESNKIGHAYESARVSSVGIEMAVSIVLGWGVGYWIDHSLNTAPTGMLLGLAFGIGAAFIGLFRGARLVSRQLQNSSRP